MNIKSNMKAVGRDAKNIVTNMMSSDVFKSIIPGAEALQKEVINYASQSSKVKSEIARNAIESTLNRASINIDDNIYEALKNIDANDLSSSVEKLKNFIPAGTGAGAILNKATNDATDAISNITSDTLKSRVPLHKRGALYAEAYFNNPDKKVNFNRKAGAVAGYAGVAIGGRYLTGGTLTTDNYGRTDIAGIPFI